MQAYSLNSTAPVLDNQSPLTGILASLTDKLDHYLKSIPKILKKDEVALQAARAENDWKTCVYLIRRFTEMEYLLKAPRLIAISQALHQCCTAHHEVPRWDLIDPLLPTLLKESKAVRVACQKQLKALLIGDVLEIPLRQQPGKSGEEEHHG